MSTDMDARTMPPARTKQIHATKSFIVCAAEEKKNPRKFRNKSSGGKKKRDYIGEYYWQSL
jgi:hypothetical protein